MRKLYYLIIILPLFCLVGCYLESALEPPAGKTYEKTIEVIDPTVLPLDKAISKLEAILENIDVTTKGSRTARKIRDHHSVGWDCGLKSENPDGNEAVLSYVFNFEDDCGYAIVAGDVRIPQPVMIVTDSGHLDPEEEIDDPGLIIMLALAANYYRNQIAASDNENEVETRTIEYGPWSIFQSTGRRTFLNWGQGAPFNNNLPRIGGEKPQLGCTATATMLLMAWHRYPETYDGHTYNWNEMLLHRNTATNGGSSNNDSHDDIAKLSEIITRSENLDMDFGVEESGAFTYNIPRTLQRLGYSHGGTFADWDESTVISHLYYGHQRPIVVSAYAFRELYSYWDFEWVFMGFKISKKYAYKYTEGHAFLLEHGLTRVRKVTTGNSKNKLEYQTLYYANMGWYGKSNGYYHAGIFDTNNGLVTRSEGEEDNFQFKIQMVYGATK